MRNRRTFFKPFILLVVLWCVAGGVAAEAKQVRPALEAYLKKLGYAAVPLVRGSDNHLLVQATVGGKKRVFSVDTGFSVSSVNKKIGKQFKTAAERGIEIKDAILGSSTNGDFVLIDELTLGEARLLNEPAMVNPVNSSALAAASDGILGADFLVRHFCLIDCLDLRLYLRSAELSGQARAALEETLRGGGMHLAPLRKTKAICRTCAVVINGETADLLVDTGAVYTVLDDATARRCQLKWGQTNEKLLGLDRVGSAALYVTRPESVKAGGVELPLHGICLCVAELHPWQVGDDKNSPAGGFLGADLLAADGCLIDLANDELWFVPQTRK